MGALETRGRGLGLPTSGGSFDGVEVGYVCELDALPVALIVADEEGDHEVRQACLTYRGGVVLGAIVTWLRELGDTP